MLKSLKFKVTLSNEKVCLFFNCSQTTEIHWNTQRSRHRRESRDGPDPRSSSSQKTALEEVFRSSYSAMEPVNKINWGVGKEIDQPSIPFSSLWLHLAKAYLSIPATSVPSKQHFSTAGHIVNYQRSLLLPENVDYLVFLKHIRLFTSGVARDEIPPECHHFDWQQPYLGGSSGHFFEMSRLFMCEVQSFCLHYTGSVCIQSMAAIFESGS